MARRRGLKLMCWTYDPLRAVNAHLNIHKLGATSRRYIANAYAVSTSPRDTGAAIDRLWMEWDLTGRSRAQPLSVEGAQVVLRDEGKGPSEPNLFADTPLVIVQIPPDIDAVRAARIEGVVAWRNATSVTFTHYFARGYVACDFLRSAGYVLSRVGAR